MAVLSAQFADALHEEIITNIDGSQWALPASAVTERDSLIGDQVAKWVADGNTIAPYVPPEPTVDDVLAERARRLALGFDYDFGGDRGPHRIGTTDSDMKGWDVVTKSLQARINIGQPNSELDILTDTGPVTVTALEWQGVLVAAEAFEQPLYRASFILQAMNPIPADFRSDSYWQVSP